MGTSRGGGGKEAVGECAGGGYDELSVEAEAGGWVVEVMAL